MAPVEMHTNRESASRGDRTSTHHSNAGADLAHIAQEVWGPNAVRRHQIERMGVGASASIEINDPVANVQRVIGDLLNGPRLRPYESGTTLLERPSILPNLDLF